MDLDAHCKRNVMGMHHVSTFSAVIPLHCGNDSCSYSYSGSGNMGWLMTVATTVVAVATTAATVLTTAIATVAATGCISMRTVMGM